MKLLYIVQVYRRRRDNGYICFVWQIDAEWMFIRVNFATHFTFDTVSYLELFHFFIGG